MEHLRFPILFGNERPEVMSFSAPRFASTDDAMLAMFACLAVNRRFSARRRASARCSRPKRLPTPPTRHQERVSWPTLVHEHRTPMNANHRDDELASTQS